MMAVIFESWTSPHFDGFGLERIWSRSCLEDLFQDYSKTSHNCNDIT